jgi:hypothetical protein
MSRNVFAAAMEIAKIVPVKRALKLWEGNGNDG